MNSTNQELLRKYRKELQLRKKCHNELVRLKGLCVALPGWQGMGVTKCLWVQFSMKLTTKVLDSRVPNLRQAWDINTFPIHWFRWFCCWLSSRQRVDYVAHILIHKKQGHDPPLVPQCHFQKRVFQDNILVGKPLASVVPLQNRS